jgi:hypothetical protein
MYFRLMLFKLLFQVRRNSAVQYVTNDSWGVIIWISMLDVTRTLFQPCWGRDQQKLIQLQVMVIRMIVPVEASVRALLHLPKQQGLAIVCGYVHGQIFWRCRQNCHGFWYCLINLTVHWLYWISHTCSMYAHFVYFKKTVGLGSCCANLWLTLCP